MSQTPHPRFWHPSSPNTALSLTSHHWLLIFNLKAAQPCQSTFWSLSRKAWSIPALPVLFAGGVQPLLPHTGLILPPGTHVLPTSTLDCVFTFCHYRAVTNSFMVSNSMNLSHGFCDSEIQSQPSCVFCLVLTSPQSMCKMLCCISGEGQTGKGFTSKLFQVLVGLISL